MLLHCCAGLLANLSTSLLAFVQYTQQQLAAGHTAAAGWDKPLMLLLLKLMHPLLAAWRDSVSSTPALVPAVVHTLLPLVTQLLACSSQLAEAAAHSPKLPLLVSVVHQAAVGVLCELVLVQGESDQLPLAVAEQLQSLLQHPSVAALLLQKLAACIAPLHQRHKAYRRVQQQQQQQQ
jgi:hypothetical protein